MKLSISLDKNVIIALFVHGISVEKISQYMLKLVMVEIHKTISDIIIKEIPDAKL